AQEAHVPPPTAAAPVPSAGMQSYWDAMPAAEGPLAGEPGPTRNDSCWVDASYLLFGIKDAPLPAPIVNRVFIPSGGLFDRPFLGGKEVPLRVFAGLHLAAGTWIEGRPGLGVEVSGFALEGRSRTIGVTSDDAGNPGLNRPLVGADGQPIDLAVSIPDVLSGRVNVTAQSRLWGLEA